MSGIFLVTLALFRFGPGGVSLINRLSPLFTTSSFGEHNQKNGNPDEDKGHDERPGHDGYGKHSGAVEHAGENIVRLSEAERKEFGIELATAGPQKSQIRVSLSGEVVVNEDRLAHIVANVPGAAREVRKKLGDQVRAGEVMAVLASRELADAKARYLAAMERVVLARTRFAREKTLWGKKISSEQEYLDAKQGLAEVRIELSLAEQKLHALGFSKKYLQALPRLPDSLLTRYEIVAPIRGTVIQKHITQGELIDNDTRIYTIADLGNTWANLIVYQKDLVSVHPGQKVMVRADQGGMEAAGTLDYVSPFMDPSTRTATARAVLDNSSGLWRPGTFITGVVNVSEMDLDVAVLRSALQTIDNQAVVFVQTDDGFKPRSVQIGRSDNVYVEIVSGLESGQRYVGANAFTLKAELDKGAFGQGHAH